MIQVGWCYRGREVISLVSQLTIRNIDAGTMASLRTRAARNGRSVEKEIREILSDAVRAEDASDTARLGSRLRKRFAHIGLEEGIVELRGPKARPADDR
jgi:antitoxin FitA